MSEAAWNKAFTQGSSALKKRLMDVHAKNPKFQSWLKSSGHGAGQSVKQASKEVKSSERVKQLQAKSLKAYGATKGTRMGSADGSGEELKDTIKPLTRDQHSKVQAAARAAKKTPLTKDQRMAAIAASVRKYKEKHDVPTVDPDDEGHDDLRDIHQSLHIRKGYNEEVEQMDEISPGLARKAAAASQVKAIEFSDYSGLSNLHNKEGKKEANRLNRKSDKAMDYIGKRQGQKGVDKVNRMVTRVVGEEVEQMDEIDYKKYLKVSQEKRPFTIRTVDAALKTDKAGDPNPLRKLGNTNKARKFAQKQLTKKFNASQPARPFPVYEPGRTYVGDSVEHDGPVIDEARRMSAAEKLGRAFDRARAESEASRRRGKELLQSRVTKEMPKAATIVSDKEVKMAKGIAFDKRYKGGNMTGASNAIEKIRPGLSKHPKVAAALRSANEEREMSYGKKIAKIMLAKQSKHPIAQNMGEAVKDQADVGEYDYEGDMAKSQLRSILTNAKRLHDMLEDTTNLPEWVQSKITLAEDYILTAANYMEGEMNEEVEQVDEKIDLEKAKMGDVVKDFYKSKAPQFKGKSMAKRREMAVAAKLGAERDAGMREEVEQVEEKYENNPLIPPRPNKAVGLKPSQLAKKPAMAAEAAEGSTPTSPKEKALAAHHGDKTKITYGDVIKARLKSAAAKKMGK